MKIINNAMLDSEGEAADGRDLLEPNIASFLRFFDFGLIMQQWK